MSDTPKGTLGGKTLLGSKEVAWTIKEGVRPHIETFDLAAKDAEELAKVVGPHTLQFGSTTVNFLYVLGLAPGENPFIERVRVADRRVWWPYKVVRRFYNMRRNIGVSRIVDPISPPEILSVTPKVWYQPWTLKNPLAQADSANLKWNASDVLLDLVDLAGIPEEKAFKYHQWLAGNLEDFKKLPIENLPIVATADQAINTALKYLPEAGIYIDYVGRVVVYSKVDGGEIIEVLKAGAKLVGQGDARFVSQANVRPKEIHVLFNYSPEIRIDFDETGITEQTSESRYMDNVLPIPDFSLVVNGETLCMGTYITFDEAFTAWGAPPGFSGPLTHDIVQKAMVPFMDLWAGIELSGAFQANADWSGRVAAIKEHYRRTFRINPRYTARIMRFEASRVATVNVAKGSRAHAVCYSDFFALAAQRALYNEAKSGVAAKDFSYGVNVKGHPALPKEPATKAISSTQRAAPCEVSIEDSDQGIIRLEYKIDPYRMEEEVLPSMMTLSNHEDDVDANGLPNLPGPTGDITQKNRPVSYDAIGESHINSLPKLTKYHKASIILTAVPGAPNSENAFYRVKIKPQDVKSLLPKQAQDSLKQASGPIMEINIGASIETARVAWLDAHAGLIDELVGVTGDGSDVSDKVRFLVVNDAANSLLGASLRDIALATAARLYAAFADHIEGEMGADMDPTLVPSGWLSEVRQILMPSGQLMSKLSLPEKLQEIDIFNYLPSDARMLILKLASPDRTV